MPSFDHAATPQVRHTTVADVDEHTEQLADWTLQYEQLDAGAFRGAFTDVRWPGGLQLFAESTSRRVRQRGHLPAGVIGIGLMIAGDGALAGTATEVGAVIASEGAELDFCTPANCTLAGLVVDASLLRDSLAACAPRLLDGHEMLTLATANAAPLRATLHEAVMQQGLGNPALRDELLYRMVAVLSATAPDELHSPDQRKRLVDQACALLLARPDDPPSLLDVCRAVGASPRKLGYCFHDVLGLSPQRYIKAIRLNAVRRELRREGASASVYDIASRWGFWHFGHFSADYKRQFNELPSQTLRR